MGMYKYFLLEIYMYGIYVYMLIPAVRTYFVYKFYKLYAPNFIVYQLIPAVRHS